MSAYLALEDGTSYKGESFASTGTSIGEIVFNTSMTGYQEIITDPSYSGQIITMTYPEIGNYGISPDDNESNKSHARGFVIKRLSNIASSWRSEKTLEEFLKENNIIGIQGVDTRAITRKIRSMGALRAVISTEIDDIDKLIEMARKSPSLGDEADLVFGASTCEPYILTPEGELKGHIAILDLGLKANIANKVVQNGFQVTVYPATAEPQDILKEQYDGIILSNGPGDPNILTTLVANVKQLIQSDRPIFGICLGHQLLGLALGCRVSKLKFGHRGGNHPVKHLASGKVEITSQNHGYAIDADSIHDDVEITYLNLNDNTIEGIQHRHKPIFSVQYHPEASPGPKDANYLFAEFLKLCG